MADRPLVSADALAARLGAADLRVVDASWHLPNAGRDAAREFADGHVPGAVFLDIDTCSAPGTLPHMLPTPASFARAAGALGLATGDDIVVYDSVGLFAAARVRWMLRLFGAERVAILDGGLPAWIAAGHALERGAPSSGPATFDATAIPDGAVASLEDVLAASRDGTARIVDARPPGRFAGTDPEPRAGLRGGHVPGSVSLPFERLLEGGRLRTNDELRALLDTHGVPLDGPLITSCGSGVTAAVVALALECVGARDVRLYDGSWAEWGAREDVPVARG